MTNYWNIPQIWEGDCFIIGGGTSLINAPFHLLHDKHTIGCNNAFELGPEVCEICCFGDLGFYNTYTDPAHNLNKAFLEFPGLVVTNATKLPPNLSEIKVCNRSTARVEKATDTLGWFKNTGALSVELATKLGASRIILLGFDMKLGNSKKANWYVNKKDKPNPKLYPKFMSMFAGFASMLTNKFPNVEIINGNPDSAMNLFPKQDWRELV